MEVSLSREEWHQLHDKANSQEPPRIEALNLHPLNIAARTLLERSNWASVRTGRLDTISVLELACTALPDGEIPEGERSWMVWDGWRQGICSMELAIAQLEEHEITVEDLLEKSPREAAELILDALGIEIWIPRSAK